MSEYGKKLHIRKSGVVTNISLYTTAAEVGSPCLCLRDGSTPLFAPLCATSDGDASQLRIRRSGTVYAVKKVAIVHGNKLITSNTTFIVPSGVTQLTVTASAGGGGGTGYCEDAEGGLNGENGGNGGNTIISSYISLTGGQGGYWTKGDCINGNNGYPYVALPSAYSAYGNGGYRTNSDSCRGPVNGGHGGTCVNSVITVQPNQNISITIGIGGDGGGAQYRGGSGTAGFVYLAW